MSTIKYEKWWIAEYVRFAIFSNIEFLNIGSFATISSYYHPIVHNWFTFIVDGTCSVINSDCNNAQNCIILFFLYKKHLKHPKESYIPRRKHTSTCHSSWLARIESQIDFTINHLMFGHVVVCFDFSNVAVVLTLILILVGCRIVFSEFSGFFCASFVGILFRYMLRLPIYWIYRKKTLESILVLDSLYILLVHLQETNAMSVLNASSVMKCAHMVNPRNELKPK